MTGPFNTRNFLSAALTACAIAACGARGGEITPLTRVREIRALSRVEAAKALPVHVRGVVTWQSANPNGSFVVDDGDRGIYVDLFMSIERRIWKSGDIQRTETEAGAVLEIKGVTDPGGYAPIIRPMRIRRVGSGSLPPPRRVPNVRLLSGNEDAQRVEVEGVVHSVTRVNEADVTAVGMVVDGNPCRVMFEYGNELNATSLIDARVKIRGVLTPLFNLRSQVAGMKISSGGAADIEVLVPARADPFLAPRVTLDNLLPFSPDREPYHRRVTSGIVTFAKLGEFSFL